MISTGSVVISLLVYKTIFILLSNQNNLTELSYANYLEHWYSSWAKMYFRYETLVIHISYVYFLEFVICTIFMVVALKCNPQT